MRRAQSLHPSALLALAAAATVACSTARRMPASEARDARWLLAPTPAGDLVHASDTHATLVQRFGAANARRDTIYVGEGEFVRGTVLFPADPVRRVDVLWEDTLAGTRAELVRIIGVSSSRWRVAPGVGLGTTLAEIEALNGRPFTLAGFEWDYSGTVISWEGGRLDSLWGDRVTLRLSPDRDAPEHLSLQVLGDRPYSSSHAAMRALNPRVYEVLVRPR
jgi:hypothetical protein